MVSYHVVFSNFFGVIMRHSLYLFGLVLIILSLLVFCPSDRLNAADAPSENSSVIERSNEATSESSSEVRMLDVYKKGIAAYKAEKYEAAVKYLEQALTIRDPNTKDLYYAEANAILGIIYQYRLKAPDNQETAQKYYQEALRIDPTNYVAKKHLKPSEIESNTNQAVTQSSLIQENPNSQNTQANQQVAPDVNPSTNIRSGLSVGAGWPYFGLKYFFNNDFGSEFRFAFGDGINIFAGRGYWSFKKFGNFSLFAGLEGGYITFDTMNVDNTMKVTGTGYEISPFLGVEYFLDKRFSLMLDFSMAIFGMTSKDITLGDIQWVTNGALYFYPF
jgi:tetratricopeptide (TPR) repeat protein